jgi:hypothetical protein
VEYNDTTLRHMITRAVEAALANNPATTQDIIENIFVQLKPLVMDNSKAYTVAQLRELITDFS